MGGLIPLTPEDDVVYRGVVTSIRPRTDFCSASRRQPSNNLTLVLEVAAEVVVDRRKYLIRISNDLSERTADQGADTDSGAGPGPFFD